MVRQDIEFLSEGVTLRGWFYPALGHRPNHPSPAVVMAHGFSAVKEQYLDRYAEVFAGLGLAVLVYDHRNFGASEGLPRQEVDPVAQRRGYRDAISYLMTRPGVDSERIGIWGTSYSGGHVLEVAALDQRVRCVVSQVPFISGHQSALRLTRADFLPSVLSAFQEDRQRRFAGDPPAMLRAVSADPLEPCAMPGPDSFRFFADTEPFAPSWRNEVTLRSVEWVRETEPGIHIDRIAPVPLLMIVADQDHLTPADLCLQAYARALEPKALLLVRGGHFTPYVEHFDKTSSAAADWFRQHLLG